MDGMNPGGLLLVFLTGVFLIVWIVCAIWKGWWGFFLGWIPAFIMAASVLVLLIALGLTMAS